MKKKIIEWSLILLIAWGGQWLWSAAGDPLLSPGSTEITTVGTIASGTWQATAIDISSYTNLAGTAGQIILTGDTLSTPALLGDNTAGRISRRINVYIEDGTNAGTIKPSSSSRWNGDANAAEDNLGKSGDTGNFTLNAGGNALTLQNSGLTGSSVTITGVNIVDNASGTVLTVEGIGNSGDLVFSFRNASTGVDTDLTSLVDTGVICYDVTYLTDA